MRQYTLNVVAQKLDCIDINYCQAQYLLYASIESA